MAVAVIALARAARIAVEASFGAPAPGPSGVAQLIIMIFRGGRLPSKATRT